MRDQGAQLAAVLAFKKRIEEEKRYLFRQYDPIDQFAEMLKGHLASWLRDHESAATGPLASNLATTGGAAGAPPPASPGFDYWIVEANRLLETGAPDHNAALFCATKAINAAANPPILSGHGPQILQGVAQFHLGKLDQSITVFTSIIERFATSIDADRREWQAKGTLQQGDHTRRAQSQRGGDCRLRRSAGPLRHGNRVAAARAGRQGARQQGGQARRARPQRRRRSPSTTIWWPASARPPSRRCASRSPTRSSTRGSRSARSTAARRRSPSTTIWSPASARPPSRRCANGRQARSSTRGHARRADAARRRSPSTTIWWPASARRPSCRCASWSPTRSSTRVQARRARPQRGGDRRLRRLLARFGTATGCRCASRSPSARQQGGQLGALGRSEEEIAVYDDWWPASARPPSRRCASRSPRRSSTKGSGSARSAAARRRSPSTTIWSPASARQPSCRCASRSPGACQQGVRLGALGRSEEAIAVYDDVVARFGTATELPLRELVASALVNKGFRLGALGRSEEAIAVYDDAGGALRHGHRCRCASWSPGARQQGGQARRARPQRGGDRRLRRCGGPLRHGRPSCRCASRSPRRSLNKGVRLGALGRSEEAIAVYDDLVAASVRPPSCRCASRSPRRSSTRGSARRARPQRGGDRRLRRCGGPLRHRDRAPLRDQVAMRSQQGGQARRARPQRGGDRRLRRYGGPLRHGHRAVAARTGRQGALQQGGQARCARPQRGGDRRLRRCGGPLRHGHRVAAARTGRQGALQQGVRLDALGRSEEAIAVYDDCWPASARPPSCRCANRSPRRSSTRGSRSARSAAARRRSRSSTMWWPASHGHRAAAARTGRNGRSSAKGFA